MSPAGHRNPGGTGNGARERLYFPVMAGCAPVPSIRAECSVWRVESVRDRVNRATVPGDQLARTLIEGCLALILFQAFRAPNGEITTLELKALTYAILRAYYS